MRAIVLMPEGAVLMDVPKPSPKDDEVLVQIKAAACNQADLLILGGAAHGTFGKGGNKILGLEFAGVVVEVGSKVTRWKVGDRVMGSGNSTFAEYVVPNREMYALPEQVPFTQGTTMPIAMQTMHNALLANAGLTAGQTCLFNGAGSAVGLMGMQIAKAKGAGKVIGTSNSPEKCKKLLECGADVAVNTNDKDWADQVLAATDGEGVDIVVDFLAGPYVNDELRVTKVGGCFLNIGRLAGEQGQMDFNLHNMRCIKYIGSSFRMRSRQQIDAIVSNASNDMAPALAAGELKMPVDSIYPLEKTAEALDRMSKNLHFGKIVITVDEG